MMKPDAVHAHGLKDNLRAVLAGTHTRQQFDAVLRTAHALSCAFLARKKSTWSLTSLHGFTLTDLAYDCIADLFQQDNDGLYPQINAYFKGLPFESLPEVELFSHFRRLVISKTGHRVFRILKEFDPALGKVLRNIKNAVHTLKNYNEIERFGETYLTPTFCDTLEHLRPPDRDDLMRLLHMTRGKAQHVPDLLASLSLGLREQSEHSRLVPIMALGLAIRDLFAPDPLCTTEPESDQQLMMRETEKIVRSSSMRIKKKMENQYVDKNKVDELTFSLYFEAIEKSILHRLLGAGAEKPSYYKLLRVSIQGLTMDEYRQHHKSQLEYLGRVVFEDVARQIKSQ